VYVYSDFPYPEGYLGSAKANGGFLRLPAASILTSTKSRGIIGIPVPPDGEGPFSFCCEPTVTETVYKYFSRPVPKEASLLRFWKGVIRMQETPIDAMRKREELKGTRNLLFKRFLKNPMDTRLALKIKSIDDQVAECSERMRQNRKRRF